MGDQRKTKLTLEVSEKDHNREWDETFQRISWWDTDKVKGAKVMVVGAGALGNEVLKNLALLNVGHILIIDFDIIEYDNLAKSVLFRQSDCDRLKSEVAAERVKEINPNVTVKALSGDIMIDVGLGVFRRMDVIIGCLDNRIARLYINRHSFKVGKTWIDGAIENLAGSLNVYKPEVSCYECQLSDKEWEVIQYRMGCADVAQRNANFGKIPTTPISSSIIGAMQVQEALKVIYGNEKQSLAGQQFQYEGMNNFILLHQGAELLEDCESHALIDEVTEAKELTNESTIKETLDWLKEKFDEEDPKIQLDYDVILELTAKKTNKSKNILLPKPHLSDDVLLGFTEPGEEAIITEYANIIDYEFAHQDAKLKDIGVPPLQILTVEAANDIKFVELTGNEGFLDFV